MALRKPVVAFDVGGIGEMVKDGVTGALVRGNPPDIEGLAAAMLRYLRNPALRAKHGAEARLHIERDFEAKRHARVLLREMQRVARLGR
jgi:glycosyltransferase involved in cell wall biosynthesis